MREGERTSEKQGGSLGAVKGMLPQWNSFT